jgi:7,8-dihydropterin-6-yl-methyl-4-(beta-D-ribofuranosyl)aminobenzene 5'-phosphate synthase
MLNKIVYDISGDVTPVDLPIYIRQLDKLRVTVIIDNYSFKVQNDSPIAERLASRPGVPMHTEHGLSYVVETTVDEEISFFLFDFGLSPGAVIKNLASLNINLGAIQAFGLSHGHLDHWGGLVQTLKVHRRAGSKNTLLYLGEEAFAPRFSGRLWDTPCYLGQLDIKQLTPMRNLTIKEIRGPTEVIPGGYFTGYIERVTEYEKARPTLLIARNERHEIDDFKGEQAMIFSVKNKGLVILSGCAHAGIVNTVKHARKISGISTVHAIMGGFHLLDATMEIIKKTVEDIKFMTPNYVIPTHCSGYEAMVRFYKEMPEQFVLSTAGSRFTFSS